MQSINQSVPQQCLPFKCRFGHRYADTDTNDKIHRYIFSYRNV